MHNHFGHQHWWPAETPFEVCVGAILTQNTNWANVRRAIKNLKTADLLEPRRLWAVPENKLANLIRPAGYFNIKAIRLRAFLKVLVEQHDGRLERLFEGEILAVRERLLAIHGIGPETADSMLLYAGRHLSFVIDAYTRRIFHRHKWAGADATYDDLQKLCAGHLSHKSQGDRLDYWQDYHAQLVATGNRYCRKNTPLCSECPLQSLLPESKKKSEL